MWKRGKLEGRIGWNEKSMRKRGKLEGRTGKDRKE